MPENENPTPVPPPTPPAPPVPGTPPWGDDPNAYDADRAAKLIADLREDKAKADQRVTDAVEEAVRNAQADLAKTVGKSLGLVADDTPASADELVAQIREKDDTIATQATTIQELTATNAVLRHADKLNASIDELTDSSSFQRKLLALDTSAADYDSQVETLVKDAVDKNPRFRKVQVASRSGGDRTPTGDTTSGEPDDIDAIRKKRAAERSQ